MKSPGPLVIGAVLGLAFGAAATVCQMQQRPLQPGQGGRGQFGAYAPAVTLAAAEEAAVGKTLDVIGEARSVKSVALISEATGIVAEVNIAPGKHVAEGDVLLRLDDQEQRIALDRARAQYPIAKDNADRYASLAQTEAASPLEAEAAFNNFKAVEADLRAAQFAVQQRTIRAPFDGVIGLTEIEAGDYLRAGDMVTTLDDTSFIIVEFAVPQEAASSVSIGQDVTARLASGGGAPKEGRVTAIDSRVNATSRTLKIEATFDNDDGALLPGAIFAVSTTSEGEPAAAVPGLAIQWDRSGAYVWKRGPDGTALRAEVNILQRTDDVVLVSGAVKPGDAVVSEGADRVRLGLPLPPGPPAGRRESAAGAAVSAPGAMAGDG
jgi:RND family efflux transporter MFP subunit